MKILEKEPLNLAEVKELVEKLGKDGQENPRIDEMKAYLKKFTKLKAADARKMKEELQVLDIIKIKSEHIVKIIDLLPEDAADLNKIAPDANLDENETNKILEVVKKYK